MAIPMSSFAGVLRDLSDDRAANVSDRPPLAERRSKYRYPLDLSIRFRSVSGLCAISGEGRTLNLSSGGVLVLAQHVALHEISEGARVELSIEWPSLLNGKIPLQLLAHGRILRLGVSVFAATFERHQFRTRRILTQSAGQGERHVIEHRLKAMR
jgi:hypothetical protein